MQIKKLDHINIRTTQIDVMTEWYTSVLGLINGERPPFPFPGAWLYAGKNAVVHLTGIDGQPGIGSEQSLKLEHYAFTANGAQQFDERLAALHQEYKRSVSEITNSIMFNLRDPDGNHIHVDFDIAELGGSYGIQQNTFVNRIPLYRRLAEFGQKWHFTKT